MSSINPNYELPSEDTVVVDCRQLDVTGHIRSPTITAIEKEISDHVNDTEAHSSGKTLDFVTDGVSMFYTVTHHLGRRNLAVTFYDVTSVPQKLLFVNWESVSNDEIRIIPDVLLPAGKRIQLLIQ